VHFQKLLFGENPDKICENLGKIGENLLKIPGNTCKKNAKRGYSKKMLPNIGRII